MSKEYYDKEFRDKELHRELSKELYAFQVAQIRVKETGLLSDQALESLITMKTVEECVRFLQERGWGSEVTETPEEILKEEQKKSWKLISQLCNDKQIHYFDLFKCNRDFHNMKAAIKEVYAQKETPNVYMEEGAISVERLKNAAAENDFMSLPDALAAAAGEARNVLFATGDSQLCDVIMDKAALTEMLRLGKATGNELLKDYAELICVAADISIAVRACKARKDGAFIQRALVECDTLNVQRLEVAARNGLDSIYEYLEQSGYSDAVPEIKAGGAAFDKWCDDRMTRLIKPQKYNAFSISPLIAYVLAKENEIKSVRIILSGIINELPEEKVRERIRESYV